MAEGGTALVKAIVGRTKPRMNNEMRPTLTNCMLLSRGKILMETHKPKANTKA
jgi:hypothetical protein